MTSSAPARPRALSLQFKLLGALSLGLVIIVLAALAGLGSAWRNLSAEVPVEVARQAQAELLQREFRARLSFTPRTEGLGPQEAAPASGVRA